LPFILSNYATLSTRGSVSRDRRILIQLPAIGYTFFLQAIRSVIALFAKNIKGNRFSFRAFML
jgi:hypothetical protein